MDFNPVGVRAWTRRLRAHTLVDVAEYFTPDQTPVRKTRGKLRKDGYGWLSVKEYLEDKYLDAQISKRKARYEPSQIVRNFKRSGSPRNGSCDGELLGTHLAASDPGPS